MEIKLQILSFFIKKNNAVHNKAVKRIGDGKFEPEMIDTKLCTHIIYKYAVLDDETLTMKVGDKLVDLDKNMYRRVTDLKKLGKKVMIALGGWKDSRGDKYGKLLTDHIARKNFIINALEFIDKYNFDGLDLVLKVSLSCFKIIRECKL